MADMRKVNSGDSNEYSAATHNRFIDATLWTEAQRASRDRLPKIDIRADGICYVKNSSGANRDRFDILGINGPWYSPRTDYQPFLQSPLLDGGNPDDVHYNGKFVVLAEPIVNGEIGLAWCSGICPVKLDPSTLPSLETEVTHADIIVGENSQLAAGGSGARVIWIDSADDAYDRWALIRLESGFGIQRFISGETNKIGGPRNSGGISFRVLMWLVSPLGGHSTDNARRVEVDCSRLNGLIFPAGAGPAPEDGYFTSPAFTCYAFFDGEEWRAIAGGITYFEGTVAAVDPISVTPDIGGANVPNVSANAFCDEELLEGLHVGVQVYDRTSIDATDCLRVVNVCCGEEELGT